MDRIEIPSRALDPIERVTFALRSLYSAYGYTQYKMGKFEEYDFYSRNKDFLVSDGVITFTDTNGKLMALKPDVTLSIVRNGGDPATGVRKLYYDENVYRVSKGSNAFREIRQAGLECIGGVDSYHVGEVMLLAAKSLAAASDEYALVVSDLDVLSAFVAHVSDDPAIAAELMKCVGEKNLHGMTEVCERHGVAADRAAPLRALVSLYGDPSDVLSRLGTIENAPDVSEAADRLSKTLAVFADKKYAGKVQLDFSIVCDLAYYNGIVFKGFVSGVPDGVLSGGQYDRLMEKLGRRARALGFAVYLDKLERLAPANAGDGSDVALVYGDCADACAIAAAVEKLVSDGLSVTAVKDASDAAPSCKVMKLENGEVISLENDA